MAVQVPPLGVGSALVHRKLSFHERPAITVAANVTVRDGSVTEARLTVGSAGVRAQRLAGAEQAVIGLDGFSPQTDQLRACAEAAGREAEPVADANGSVEYKRQLVRVLVGRCVAEAVAQSVLA